MVYKSVWIRTLKSLKKRFKSRGEPSSKAKYNI